MMHKDWIVLNQGMPCHAIPVQASQIFAVNDYPGLGGCQVWVSKGPSPLVVREKKSQVIEKIQKALNEHDERVRRN